MKKIIIAAILALGAMTACNGQNNSNNNTIKPSSVI